MSRFFSRAFLLTPFLGLMLMLFPGMAAAQYKLVNLSSNQFGAAKHTDPLLVNGWGLVYGPGGPFWVSDQGSGWSTLYDGTGVKQGLQVVVPSASGAGPGQPTGIVHNGSMTDFQIGGWPTFFIFVTLDGTISGWAPQTNFNDAIIEVTTPGAVYTGLAITNNPAANLLFAADAANNKVDVYDGTFTLVNSFTDTTLPAGFAPFGIQDIDGLVYVSFASSSGAGGFIDVFSEGGVFLKQLAHGKPLNQPWGFAVAPSNFGPLSNTLLVTNNTNRGTINAFNLANGDFVGTVKDTSGKNIVIDQLWGIEFGGGSAKNGPANELFFTAGPDNNLAGTFGGIKFEKNGQ